MISKRKEIRYDSRQVTFAPLWLRKLNTCRGRGKIKEITYDLYKKGKLSIFEQRKLNKVVKEGQKKVNKIKANKDTATY